MIGLPDTDVHLWSFPCAGKVRDGIMIAELDASVIQNVYWRLREVFGRNSVRRCFLFLVKSLRPGPELDLIRYCTSLRPT
jgi:hypothetical protein